MLKYGLVSGLDYTPTRYGDLGVKRFPHNSCNQITLKLVHIYYQNIVDNFNIVNIYVDP